ncbi:SpoIIE family protein phosphatase [Jatrophihabitans sp. YIM 134969]
MRAPSRHPVEDASQVRAAVDDATAAARDAGFGPAAVDRITLVVKELAENLHRHAVGGELLVLPPVAADNALVVVAVDRGPGVDGFERCFTDGYSTVGTMGVGLGTVRRLADRVDAVSEPGRGTVVAASFRTGAGGRSASSGDVGEGPSRVFDVAGVGFALDDGLPNGDQWSALHRGARLIVVVADGLGHGPDAAAAGAAVVDAVPSVADRPPAEMFAGLAEAAAHTRGAAATVATLTTVDVLEGGAVESAGLGNVALVVVAPDGSTHRGISVPGTVGRSAPAARSGATAFPPGGTLVLHTDGLTTRWDLLGRAPVLRHDAAVVAAVLWRDFGRGTDDSCVVVVRAGAGA